MEGEIINCPNCGQEVPPHASSCQNCGTEIGVDQERPQVPDGGTIIDKEPVPYLVITAGHGRGQMFDLRGEVRLGRSRTNAVALTDGKVSRNHARLDPVRKTYILTDLGSANGTFVNGVRITQPVRLRDGDTLQVGDTQLVFHAHPSPSVPQAAHAANYPPPRYVATDDARHEPGGRSLPVGARGGLPSWAWIGCAALIVVMGLLVIVALTTGILIGQGLVGG